MPEPQNLQEIRERAEMKPGPFRPVDYDKHHADVDVVVCHALYAERELLKEETGFGEQDRSYLNRVLERIKRDIAMKLCRLTDPSTGLYAQGYERGVREAAAVCEELELSEPEDEDLIDGVAPEYDALTKKEAVVATTRYAACYLQSRILALLPPQTPESIHQATEHQ